MNKRILKPCPFCGSEAKVMKGFAGLSFMRCDKCGAMVSFEIHIATKKTERQLNIAIGK